MCRLIKYYETDCTIFLLIEHVQNGRLYQYLESLMSHGDSFLEKIKEKTSCQENDEAARRSSLVRRRSFPLKLIQSMASLSSAQDKRLIKTRSHSVKSYSPSIDSTKFNLTKLTEVQLDNLNLVDDTNEEPLASSSSSLSSTDSNQQRSDQLKPKNEKPMKNSTATKEVEFMKIEEMTSFVNVDEETPKNNRLSWPLNVFSNSIKLFGSENKTNLNSADKPHNKLTVTNKPKANAVYRAKEEPGNSMPNEKQNLSIEEDSYSPYLKRVKLW